MKNEGIENLRLASKLFFVRKAMVDLNCQVLGSKSVTTESISESP